jgi:dTDP-4-dehydrorhamnose 3,5-epimerase
MQFTSLDLPGLVLVEPRAFEDARGFFMETWQARVFEDNGISADFVQDNHSRSARGVLRGLHYQVARPQGKLVRVIVGAVFDVAVDLRRGSPTFGRWTGLHLSAQNRRMLWIPPGFAHGFYVLSEVAESVYKCTDFHFPEHDRCLLWNDSHLGIAWPLIDDQAPLLSDRDRCGRPLSEAELYS